MENYKQLSKDLTEKYLLDMDWMDYFDGEEELMEAETIFANEMERAEECGLINIIEFLKAIAW